MSNKYVVRWENIYPAGEECYTIQDAIRLRESTEKRNDVQNVRIIVVEQTEREVTDAEILKATKDRTSSRPTLSKASET